MKRYLLTGFSLSLLLFLALPLNSSVLWAQGTAGGPGGDECPNVSRTLVLGKNQTICQDFPNGDAQLDDEPDIPGVGCDPGYTEISAGGSVGMACFLLQLVAKVNADEDEDGPIPPACTGVCEDDEEICKSLDVRQDSSKMSANACTIKFTRVCDCICPKTH